MSNLCQNQMEVIAALNNPINATCIHFDLETAALNKALHQLLTLPSATCPSTKGVTKSFSTPYI